MDANELRASARTRVSGLTSLIPDPWDLEQFVERLSTHRQRPITLRPFEAAGGSSPCGLYLATQTEDIVLYPAQAFTVQRDHVVLHEIAHVLFDSTNHDEPTAPTPAIDHRFAALVFPDIPLELIRQYLERTEYTTEVEQQAESFADAVRHLIDERRRTGLDGMTPQQRAIAQRLGTILHRPTRSDDG